jgi:6-phosphogluconolactonase
VEQVSTGGQAPRNFDLDPTGKYLFAENQNSNTVVAFAIDQESGKLTPTGDVLNVPRPVCLRWVPVS